MNHPAALTGWERAIATLLVGLFACILGWIVVEIGKVDDKREAGHLQLVQQLNESSKAIQAAINETKLKQVEFETKIRAQEGPKK